MMDKKILEALGAPKEGHEWKEFTNLSVPMQIDDAVLTAAGYALVYTGGWEERVLGAALGTGKFYRQVPIEPPVEVICEHGRARVFSNGLSQFLNDLGEWGDDRWEPFNDLGEAYAALYAKNQANEARADKAEAKLREIKWKSGICDLEGLKVSVLDWSNTICLVELCRSIELPSDTDEVKA